MAGSNGVAHKPRRWQEPPPTLADVADLGITPPCDIEAEKCILGLASMNLECSRTIAEHVGSESFYLEGHQLAWHAIQDAQERGDNTDDPLLMADAFRRAGIRGDVHQFVFGIRATAGEGQTDPITAKHLAWIVADMAKRRQAYYVGCELAALALDGKDISGWEGRLERLVAHRRFSPISASELATRDFEITPLIEGLLYRGQNCVVAGSSKTLKTSLLLAMSLRIAVGGMLWNRFLVPRPARVLFLSAESGAATIKETANRQAVSMGRDLAAIDNIRFDFVVPDLLNPSDIRELRRTMKAHGTEALIVDPGYMALASVGDSAANVFSMGRALAPLTEIATETGATTILIHHARKTIQGFEPLELNSISGAGFAEWSRQWLLLSRREEWNPDAPGLHRLWLAAGGSAGHAGCYAVDVDETKSEGRRTWEVDVSSASAARAEAASEAADRREQQRQEEYTRRLQEDVGKLRGAIQKFPDGATQRKLRAAAGIPSADRVSAALYELVDTGEFEVCEVLGSNSRYYDGYRLATGSTG